MGAGRLQRTLSAELPFHVLAGRSGKIAIPSGWSVEYKSDAGWNPLELYVTDSYQVGTDRFNVVHPSGSVEVESVRILIEPQKGKSIGVSEIRFE